MKSLLIAILLTTMSCYAPLTLADRYYGDSSKVPYVKSSNRTYEKSWNSHAKRVNVQLNVIRTRAVSDRLNGRTHSNSYSSGYSGGQAVAAPLDPKVVAQCEAIMIEHNYSDSEKPSALSRCINYKMGNL